MKIRADRKALADALAWVAQAVPKRPQMPALAGIRLAAADGRLSALGYDYDASHAANVDVDVVTEGECLVSGHFLSWIVGSIKGETVELVLDGDTLTIAAGRSTYRARVLKIEDYPTLPEQPARVGTVDAGVLALAVAHAKVLVEANASLNVLQALHIEGDAGELVLVGMRRSGVIQVTVAWTCAKPFAANVYPTGLDAAVKGLHGEVTIGMEGGVLGLADGRRAVTMRTVDEEFPKWRSVLRHPDDDLIVATVENADLSEALRRAGALCDDETPLALMFSTGEIEVSIAAGERGDGSDLVVAECSDEAVLGMHARYLLDSLSVMPPGPVRIGIGHREKGIRNAPLIIRPIGEDTGRLSMVMPKNLPGGAQ